MNNRFIGVDLTDPYAIRKRPICIVEMVFEGKQGKLLHLPPSDWPDHWPRSASFLTPETVGPLLIPKPGKKDCIWMGIDGPIGLAGNKEAKAREGEKLLRAPGRSPWNYPVPGFPFAGFVTGSVVLWSWLTLHGEVAVDGSRPDLQDNKSQIHACEVFPGAAWRVFAGETRLVAKSTPVGKKQRIGVLQSMDIQVPEDWDKARDIGDRLDAALAALVAYLWFKGKTEAKGLPPVWDQENRLWREGWIRHPMPTTSEA